MKLFNIMGLKKEYNGKRVLDIDKLTLKEGKIYVLFGPNGSGKTTLLEILALLTPPTNGSIEYRGMTIKYNEAELTRLRKKIVMVHQNPVLFTTSVAKNMEFPLKVRNIPSHKRSRIIEECLDMVGMKDFLSAHAPNLSSGEKQRIAIARALACSPDVLLLDEPTSNVDAENQAIVETIISDINKKRGISVILTTHDLIQAERIADEIIPLIKGKLAKTVHENLFHSFLIKDDRNKSWLVLKQGIRIPFNARAEGPLTISINPFMIDIVYNLETEKKPLFFKGRIVQMSQERNNIRFSVDIGLPINVIMRGEDVKKKGLLVGDNVWIKIPEASISIIQH